MKGLVYKAVGQVLMRGADGCAEKHLTFQYATQCSLLIFNIMSCSVGRLKALARACCFSAPPILRSRQNGAESSAACVAEGAKSVLYARQKQTGAVYCCCRECFLKGFCASVCFQGYCVSAQGKRRHMPQAAFYSGRKGVCSTHG